jgi:hypothetical protein
LYEPFDVRVCGELERGVSNIVRLTSYLRDHAYAEQNERRT